MFWVSPEPEEMEPDGAGVGKDKNQNAARIEPHRYQFNKPDDTIKRQMLHEVRAEDSINPFF
jgi:hypothetical protein